MYSGWIINIFPWYELVLEVDWQTTDTHLFIYDGGTHFCWFKFSFKWWRTKRENSEQGLTETGAIHFQSCFFFLFYFLEFIAKTAQRAVWFVPCQPLHGPRIYLFFPTSNSLLNPSLRTGSCKVACLQFFCVCQWSIETHSWYQSGVSPIF